MCKLPLYNVCTCYAEGNQFHYGHHDLEAIKPIFPGDKLVIYHKEDFPDGNVILLD